MTSPEGIDTSHMEHTAAASPTRANDVRPFIDYYGEHDISPVSQDITDLEKHFERRASLYRSLGIPPLYVRGSDVIEFGPGSGHNALFTEHLGPRRYVMVDGNPRGLSDTRSLFEKVYPEARNYEVVRSLIEEFESPQTFDLVIAEGLVPFQLDPATFIHHIARHVSQHGILVFTCVDGSSLMGEIGRRLIAQHLIPRPMPDAERVRALAPVFAPHLATLTGMTRSVDDWIYDNVLIPFVGRTFAIDEAIEALSGEFDIYGSSPEFVVDMRWYKRLFGEERAFNERAIDQYRENAANFLDYRVTVPPHSVEVGIAINTACRDLYALMQAIEASAGTRRAAEAAPAIRHIADLAAGSPETATSLVELADLLESDATGDPNPRLTSFASYFGRGMQYVSFIRRG